MMLSIYIPKTSKITNGDVVQAAFPQADVQIWEHEHRVRVEDKVGLASWLDLSWWRAPYEGGNRGPRRITPKETE